MVGFSIPRVFSKYQTPSWSWFDILNSKKCNYSLFKNKKKLKVKISSDFNLNEIDSGSGSAVSSIEQE